ncbi:MAG: DeoR/GlpR family DNA-binding transcription regulator [Pedococcus sp.]
MRVTRHRSIVELLHSHGLASTEELAALCDVSLATVRRDLIELETAGALRRVHGGAILDGVVLDGAEGTKATGAAHDPPDTDADALRGFAEVAANDAEDKHAVAVRAAAMVADGDCVILDIGTTTMMLARELRGRAVTVVTASLAVLDVLRDDPQVELVLLGGIVRRTYHSLVGALTEDALRQVRANCAFLGASGVAADGTVLDTTLVEVPVKRAMLATSQRSVLLVDRHKFPGTGALRVCGLDEFDAVITTTGADGPTLEAARAAGTEVHVV